MRQCPENKNPPQVFSGVEKPRFSSLSELFDRTNLNEDEKDIFQKHKKDCEYFLLRAREDFIESHGDNPSYLQGLAKRLILLDSDKVTGPKKAFIKEMFSLPNKQMYEVAVTQQRNPKTGIEIGKTTSCTLNCNSLFNKDFELEILAFFIDNGFTIELFGRKNEQGKNEKGPEFIALKKELKIGIEAKNLDHNIIADRIFGDKKSAFDYERRCKEKDERHPQNGPQKIQQQFMKNYDSAMSKFDNIDDGTYSLIFISTNYQINHISGFQNFLEELQNDWTDESSLIGIAIPELYSTTFLQNKECDLDINTYLPHKKMDRFRASQPSP